MRILPRINEAVNEEWISDKTRHVVDGLRTQRLDRPYVREDGRLRAATWPEAFAAIAAKVRPHDGKRIGAIAGDLAAVEEMFALKDLLAKCGSANRRGAGRRSLRPEGGRASYIFNPTIAGIEQADALLIVGANPRKEAAVLNARIRKRWRTGQLKIGLIGAKADLTYPYDYLGAGRGALADLAAGKHAFATVLKAAKKPIVLVGAGRRCAARRRCRFSSARRKARARMSARSRTAGTVSPCCITRPRASARSISALCRARAAQRGADDDVRHARRAVPARRRRDQGRRTAPFVVYIGTHGDRGAHRADVILPGAAYTEKSAIYVNTEGRVQMTEPRGVSAR